MAFRAIKADSYNDIRNSAANLKRLATDSKNLMAAGNVSANVIRQLLDSFIAGKAKLQAASSVPGIADYAQAQEGDGAYDVQAEFTTMVNACTGVIDWIVTNIPASGGYVQLEQWSSSGVTVRTFTPAQTANLRTALDTFITTIA